MDGRVFKGRKLCISAMNETKLRCKLRIVKFGVDHKGIAKEEVGVLRRE